MVIKDRTLLYADVRQYALTLCQFYEIPIGKDDSKYASHDPGTTMIVVDNNI